MRQPAGGLPKIMGADVTTMMCASIHLSIYLSIHPSIYLSLCAYVYIYTSISRRRHVCTYIYKHVLVCARVFLYDIIYISIYIHIYVCMCIDMCVSVHVFIYMYGTQHTAYNSVLCYYMLCLLIVMMLRVNQNQFGSLQHLLLLRLYLSCQL